MTAPQTAAQAVATAAATIASLFAANVGRRVQLGAGKDKSIYRVARIAEKQGVVGKGKEKAEYVLLWKDGSNGATVASLHPEKVIALFNKGTVDNYKLLDAEAGDEGAVVEKEAASGAGEKAATVEEPKVDPAIAKAAADKAAAEKTAAKEAAKVERETKRAADKVAKETAKTAKKDERTKMMADVKAAKEAALAAEKESRAAKKAAKGPSQKDKARIIFHAAGPVVDGHRKAVIAKYRAKESDGGLDMSGPGANTYYQNFKQGTWV
jgi:hypothetical protein